MRSYDNFDIIEISGDYMAIPAGDRSSGFVGAVILNEVAVFILNAMKEDTSEEQLLDRVLSEYEVDRATAETDLSCILQQFRAMALIH